MKSGIEKVESVPLGTVATIDRQIVAPSDSEICLGLEDLDIVTGRVHIPSHRDLAKSSKFRFSSSHVLYGKLRPYLAKVARPTMSGICSTDILPILPGNRLDRDFLFHFLRTPEFTALASQAAVGINLPRLSPSILSTFHIPLPPLPSQRRIAEVLDRADALRAKRRAALAQLDSLTQSIFLDLFGDPAANPKRFPTAQLAKAIELRGGFAFKSSDYVPDGIPLVRIGEVNRGGVTREAACFLPVTLQAELTRFIVRPGDMLMSLTGTTGKDDYGNVILLDNAFSRYFLNQRVALIQPKPNVFDTQYLLHVFRNPKVKAKLISKSRGIRQANISNGDVLEMEIPAPAVELQREFACRVAAVEKLKAAQRASLAELDALFASLQHRAFRGEL